MTYDPPLTSFGTVNRSQVYMGLDVPANDTIISDGRKIIDAVQIYWKAGELSLFDPVYASALASRLHIDFTATASIISLHTQSASPGSAPGVAKPTSLAPPSSIGRGAIAGLSVAASFGGLILAIATMVFLRWWKRIKLKAQTYEEGVNDDKCLSAIAELQDTRWQANELEVQEKITSCRVR
jgi:hypothetical protein